VLGEQNDHGPSVGATAKKRVRPEPRFPRRWRLQAAVCAAIGLVVIPALADDKAACLAAAADGQKLRDAHRLVEAREQFRRCAAAACPPVVQSSCASWIDAVEKVLPTVVLSARNASGADLFDVSVSVDGKPLAARLDGKAVSMDPGPHAFHFEAAGGTADKQILVQEGTQNQPVIALIGAPPAGTSSAAAAPLAPTSATPPTPAAETPPAKSAEGSGQRTIGFVVGGAGIAGIAVGSILGLMASSAWNSAQNECGSPNKCPRPSQAVSDQQNASGLATGSTIAFAVGGVALAAGTVLLLTAPRGGSPTSALMIAPSVLPGGAGLSMKGGF
jgi:hypothetical protein